MRLLVAVAAALVLVSVGTAATEPGIVPVPWDGRKHGGVQIVSDGGAVWLLSGTLIGSNVWRVDPRTQRPERTPLPRMREIVAGDGQLWALEHRAPAAPRLYYVDVRNGYRLRAKRMPKGCGLIGHGDLVYRGRLWFHCDFDRVLVYDPRRAAPVKQLEPDGELIESERGLWLHDIRGSMRCLEGPCRGAGFPVGATGAWDAERDTGWILGDGSQAPDGFLTLVDFRARATADFRLRLPRAAARPSALRVVGDELWVEAGPPVRFGVARYRSNDPEAPPRLLRLPGVSMAAETLFAVETGGGSAWVSVEDRGEVKLFRVAEPRDPPGLRQIRAAVLRAVERTPQRLAVSRGAGLPLHASCDARGRYLLAQAYFCHVRFREAHEYMCVAIVRGRIAVDRRRLGDSSCRR